MMQRAEGVRGWLRRVSGRAGPVVPVVRLHGVIASEQRPGRLNIATVEPLLRRAFGIKSAPVVGIVVNSPGGSPVQSHLIARRIRELSREKNKRVLVFIEDAAASGGYFVAVAGDEVIADPSSIVGSVGVIVASFGFEDAIGRLGIKRRVYTAGRNKSTLDPFLPEKPADIDRIKAAELQVHQVFIDYVKSRRTDRLKGTDDELFSGEWWTGLRGLELGLVDALGDLHGVLRERYGPEVRLKVIEPRRGLFSLPRLAAARGAGGLAQDLLMTIEDRALWSRLGL